MSARFEGKSVLVTGSTGIAAAAALALHEAGARVFVVSRTAEHVDDLLRQLGPTCAGRRADLTQEAEVDKLVGEVVGEFGRLDCVYNVAGISGRRLGDGPAHEMTLEGWNQTLANNATSVFLVCRAALRQMLGHGAGAILNMSSTLARHPEPRHFATHGYAASKGAIESFSRAMAAYYAPHGIRVNVIAPGLVATPMSQRAQQDPAILAYAQGRQPLAGGILQPQDLTGAALFLLSDDSRMITGQVLDVDGGWSVSEGPPPG
ncbi:MAG TPA: SDR family oxidoreductase [Candidatus Limnocylindria bacterium]|nr:SDR family oxidoreductase [Candidatus Limnocylindria bacterium]